MNSSIVDLYEAFIKHTVVKLDYIQFSKIPTPVILVSYGSNHPAIIMLNKKIDIVKRR